MKARKEHRQQKMPGLFDPCAEVATRCDQFRTPIYTPALLLIETAAHCYGKNSDSKLWSIQPNATGKIAVKLCCQRRHAARRKLSQNVFHSEALDLEKTRRLQAALMSESFGESLKYSAMHSDLELRVEANVEIVACKQKLRFSSYCKLSGPSSLNLDSKNIFGGKSHLSSQNVFHAPTYDLHELGMLDLVRAANTIMGAFHPLRNVHMYCKWNAPRDREKSGTHWQQNWLSRKLVLRFPRLEKGSPPWLLTNVLPISRIPSGSLPVLSKRFLNFFLVTVCIGICRYLVFAQADVQKSTNGSQYTANLVKRRCQRLPRLLSKRRGSSVTILGLLVPLFLNSVAVPSIAEGTNLRRSITDGNVECLQYNNETRLFWMTCDMLEWKWDSKTYISLGADETFDGGTPDGKGIIDLTGIVDFEGLFRVDKNDVQSYTEAPLIRNIHVINGTTAKYGGFIVQKEQPYFIVDSCSSTGDIGYKGGGICGRLGGHKGEIRISNRYTTGMIKGTGAGGIAGKKFGLGGTAHITQCHSTGDIKGYQAGGVCGDVAGRNGGKLNITQSYSTGDILGQYSGGITGDDTGRNYGCVYIRESYTKGKICGYYAGGICGDGAAYYHGQVHILDSYSRGVIEGYRAGGITGSSTGEDNGAVYMENTYASGSIGDTNAGGLIGHIRSDRHIVDVKYSVYNDSDISSIVGLGDGSELTTNMGNSYDLNDIMGQLYTFNGTQRWSNNTWALNGTENLPILRFQLLQNGAQHTPTPSPSPAATSCTPTPTKSASQSVTPTPTPTASSTITGTPTPSSTTTGTDTPTGSGSPSQSATSSRTTTGTPTPTSSVTPTRSATSTRSPTLSASSSATRTPSPSTSPRGLTTKKVLPVQRPARNVDTRSQNGRRDRKRRKNK